MLKLKTSDFRILTRSRRLPHPTQRAALIFESVAALIDREADGRTFRLIGVGVGDLGPATAADPADLFTFAGRCGRHGAGEIMIAPGRNRKVTGMTVRVPMLPELGYKRFVLA